MKANEAPEKLYLQSNSIAEAGKRKLTLYKVSNDDIEYIRADAFVEKAAEYLSYHLDTSKIDVNYKFEFIEEFKKAMML